MLISKHFQSTAHLFNFNFILILITFRPMKKKSQEFYIGIDSGGTKCGLLILSDSKETLFNKVYKGVHYSVCGVEIYSNCVAGFIKDSLKRANLEIGNCLGICIGIAGAREDKDRTELKRAFVKKLNFRKILITTDAMTALYGAFEGEEGIILISGTGSVLYGFTNDRITRVGGWGRVIGDEGSGYWIGKRALNLTAKEYDNYKQSLFSKRLKEEFGIEKKNINQITFNPGFEIQRIAPLVIECASQNCRLSRQVVNEAVEGLLEHIKTFLRITKRKKPVSIAFIGSIIENKNILSEKLKKEIRKLKIVNIIRKKNNSSYGAIFLAIEDTTLIKKL